MENRKLTVEEAISLMPDGKTIHVYCNPNGMLIGADWKRKDAIKEFEANPNTIQVGGEMCRRMNHAIVVLKDDGNWFLSGSQFS